jgi:endothelin-converting enzyme
LRQDSSPVVSLAEVGAAAPVLGLDKLAAAMTPPGKTPTEIMLVYPKFWPEFAAVISNHSRAAVQGYMAWKSITSLVEYINDPELWTVIGVQTNLLPWQLCVNQVDTQLRHVLDYYFVSAAYSNQTLQAADKLTTNIRNQFKKRLGELDWMSAESKRRAIQKAENMLQTIGYPTFNPDLRSPDSIASFYAGLNLTSASHFTNMLSARRYTTLQSYATVLTHPNRNYYFQSISHANAAYDFTVNSMSVPAGISQLPLFHPDLPDYMLYGGLGATIGHEITHGFDDTGRRFDENAEYRAWWDNGTISSFQRRADCFVKQYGQYEVDVPGPGGKKARVDGNLTLGENIADAGGLHTAYDAWVAERKAMPAAWDQDLPGLGGFTHEQLFYLAWGNSWCSSLTPATVASQLTDVHAPDRVRLLAGAMNSRGFLEAWKCKTKEPVCELW